MNDSAKFKIDFPIRFKYYQKVTTSYIVICTGLVEQSKNEFEKQTRIVFFGVMLGFGRSDSTRNVLSFRRLRRPRKHRSGFASSKPTSTLLSIGDQSQIEFHSNTCRAYARCAECLPIERKRIETTGWNN